MPWASSATSVDWLCTSTCWGRRMLVKFLVACGWAWSPSELTIEVKIFRRNLVDFEENHRWSKSSIVPNRLIRQSATTEWSPRWLYACQAKQSYDRCSGCEQYRELLGLANFVLHPAMRSAFHWRRETMKNLPEWAICVRFLLPDALSGSRQHTETGSKVQEKNFIGYDD